MSETYRGSITLTSISEGRGYGIETNCEKINKFVTDNGVVEYSPDNLRISVYSIRLWFRDMDDNHCLYYCKLSYNWH